jgi:hypothetical protein
MSTQAEMLAPGRLGRRSRGEGQNGGLRGSMEVAALTHPRTPLTLAARSLACPRPPWHGRGQGFESPKLHTVTPTSVLPVAATRLNSG